MSPSWLIHNVAAAWRYRASLADFARRLLLVYSHRLPRRMRRQDWTIGFHYPNPIGGIKLLLRDNAGADLFILSEVFEHEYYRLPLTRAPATILDLGANIGLTTLYFARLFPDAAIACVEPAVDNLRVLTQNLSLNTVLATVVPAAIDIHDGQIKLELQERDYGHKVVAAPGRSGRPTIDVPALSVPTLLRQLGWDRIGLLKIDIEGHEAALFSADCEWLARVDALCIECHHTSGAADLHDLARRFVFSKPRLLPGTWFMHRVTSNASAA